MAISFPSAGASGRLVWRGFGDVVLIVVYGQKYTQLYEVRGRIKGLNNSAASCGRSGLYASYESYECPLSYAVWWPDLLQEAAE